MDGRDKDMFYKTVKNLEVNYYFFNSFNYRSLVNLMPPNVL